ncbi:hypothetical protein BJY01DRAFT_73770 [Aspergillus pseudoustus]|uniref:Peptidase of plants and bacteria-domain-containing protein n=1 Tax=Aspergillus pseudoustus TaxID=1810923 RepID=A0ABR4KM17_9EURO
MATPSAIPRTARAERPLDNSSLYKSPEHPAPKFRLQIHDLRHSSSQYFLSLIPDLASTLETALTAIIRNLYTSPVLGKQKHAPIFEPYLPPTRSVTVLLRDIGGVAYTTGKELDNDHKEIHISLQYIQHCRSKADPLAELTGVLTHELVHCYQYAAPRASADGKPDDTTPRAPGGLVEGVADFVRLKAGLEPPHWSRPSSAKERPEKWDSGYQHTAYFLAWLEDVRVGKGAVGMLNDRLRLIGYVGEDKSKDKKQTKLDAQSERKSGFWKGLFGAEIDELWEEYGSWLDNAASSQGNWEDEIVHKPS